MTYYSFRMVVHVRNDLTVEIIVVVAKRLPVSRMAHAVLNQVVLLVGTLGSHKVLPVVISRAKAMTRKE